MCDVLVKQVFWKLHSNITADHHIGKIKLVDRLAVSNSLDHKMRRGWWWLTRLVLNPKFDLVLIWEDFIRLIKSVRCSTFTYNRVR